MWWHAARGPLIAGATLSVISGVTNTVGRPLLLRWTLLAMDPSNGYSMEHGMGLALGLVGVMWLEGYTKVQAVQRMGAEAPVSRLRHPTARI